MNSALKQLGLLVDILDKAHRLPIAELTENDNFRGQVKKLMSTHNIEGILNQLTKDLREQRQMAEAAEPVRDNLLLSYARRENSRVGQIQNPREFVTQLVNFEPAEAVTVANTFLAKAKDDAEKSFETAYNTIYANGAMKINVPADPSLLSSYMDYTPYRANLAAYFSIPTLSEMVGRPLDLVFKKFPKVKSKNKKFSETAEAFFKAEQIPSVTRDALFYSVLSPRGSLTVPILQNGRVHFNAFNDTQFSYGLSSGYNSLTAPYSPTRVGPLYCMGAKLTHGVSAFFLCPGFDPLFGIGLNRVPTLREAATAWNLYVHVLKILLVRSQVLIEKLDGDIQTDTMAAQIKTMLQNLTQTMGVSSVTEQPRGTTLDILNNNIGPGTADIATVFKEFVGVVTGVAPEYFFGGSTTNYSMSAFSIATTNENLRARYQVGQLEPLLRFMLNTANTFDERFKSLGVKENEFDLEFDSIYDETSQEKADLNSKKTETLIRQREYSELEKQFKQEGLLSEEISFEGLEPDHNADDETGEVDVGEAQGADPKLVKPLS